MSFNCFNITRVSLRQSASMQAVHEYDPGKLDGKLGGGTLCPLQDFALLC